VDKRKVTILPKPEDMDIFEKQEMQQNQSVVKTKLNKWYDWLIGHVPKPIRERASNGFLNLKNSIFIGLYNNAKEKLGLKGEIEEQAMKKHNEKEGKGITQHNEKEGITQHNEKEEKGITQHKQAMNGAYKSFRVAGQNKAYANSYMTLVKPEVQRLIEVQVNALVSAKVQMHLWVIWKKEEEALITLEDDKKKRVTHEVKVEKVFNSKMTEVFQGNNVEDQLQRMFAHIKTQVEHPALPKSGFTLDHIMHPDIDFHKLVLTRGNSYIELPKWIANKKAVINPQNTDEECFKWAVTAALHHKEIEKDPQRISKLKSFA